MIFIYFPCKKEVFTLYLVVLVLLNFCLFLFSFAILLSKMKSIFQLVNKNLQNSSCDFRKYQWVSRQIFHQSSWQSNIAPLYFFSSNIIYYGQKQPIKMQIFKIFNCVTQNLSNYSCQFWIDKSIPYQILHPSSFSWHVTSLQISSWHIFYFGQKHPRKDQIFRL